MRTTLDIDDPILREVRALHEREQRSMGAIVSELLAEALSRRKKGSVAQRSRFSWTSKDMRARVDLDDKDAVYAAMERDGDPS